MTSHHTRPGVGSTGGKGLAFAVSRAGSADHRHSR